MFVGLNLMAACRSVCLSGCCVVAAAFYASSVFAEDMPTGTQPLTVEGDIAAKMVDGIDRFLLKKINQAKAGRARVWQSDEISADGQATSLQAHRARLSHMLGVRDPRLKNTPALDATLLHSGLVQTNERYKTYFVRWDILADPAPTAANLASIHGEGLLLVPHGPCIASVVAIPDADNSPEQLCGLAEGIPAEKQFARHLAEAGCQVIVPVLISRELSQRNGRSEMTNREYLYRPAFELGRQLIGYELQKVLAAVDWFETERSSQNRVERPIIVVGQGEGGMLAMYAGALDERIHATAVIGYFAPRESCWQEPLDRNVFGRLQEFGDAQLGHLIAPRRLVIGNFDYPQLELTSTGGAPAVLKSPTPDEFSEEYSRLQQVFEAAESPKSVQHIATTTELLPALFPDAAIPAAKSSGNSDGDLTAHIAARHQRQFEEIDRHNQALLRESAFVRTKFLKKLDQSSVDNYEKSVEQYRDVFRSEAIGAFDDSLLPMNARSRRTWETEKYTGHEVMLDVFPDVMAYGVLLVPKDLKPGEKRPVVVCQHGLEGRPTDTFLNDHYAYHDFAARLCERGFITFAPQNPYIFKNKFRTLQRKANPLGKTLFSVIVPQHQQIVNWLKTQPNVDADRIAFYGLSYGGKSAMRIPALVTDYCLSICSADFNEWVTKNASTRHNFSYVWTGEYEIFEWDLGSTFNYFEMAALICPRPFMVERGHFDGVGTDDWVAHEYAKVRHLYAAKLGIGERTEIEWFVGPHTINGTGTYRFLHKHLNWPEPQD